MFVLSPFLKIISSRVLSREGFHLPSVWHSSEPTHPLAKTLSFTLLCVALILPVQRSQPILINFSPLRQNGYSWSWFSPSRIHHEELWVNRKPSSALFGLSTPWKASSFPLRGRMAFRVLPFRFLNTVRWGSWEETQILWFLWAGHFPPSLTDRVGEGREDWNAPPELRPQSSSPKAKENVW